jgi:hypothetical protein
MPGRTRAIRMVLSIAIAAMAVPSLAAAKAGATASVTLTKDVTVGAPPSGTFAGAASGDGWDVLFYRDRILNVFHHGSQFLVDCHLQADGSHCDTVAGISPWPKTVSSPAPASDLTSPAHSSGWVDATNGHLYAWTSRSSDGVGGVACVDLNSSAANPFCGFTALTGAAPPQDDITPFGGRSIIGGNMLTYDTTTRKVLCFSTATRSACPGQPFDVSIGGITPALGGWINAGTLAAAGKMFVHVEDNAFTGGVLTCFDPQTHTTCAGSWPQLVADSYPGAGSLIGAPFPFLSANGAATGVCLPYDTVDPCWDLTGASMPTPAALVSAIGQVDYWNEGTVFGTRVFVATGDATGTNADGVYCYDFATAAGCPNFPIETAGNTYLYTVTPDPVRTGCMWINADNSNWGGSQIRTFDGFDGTPGCSDRVHVTSSVVIPDAGCEALGWTNVQVLDPSPAGYTSATLSITDTQGNAVPGGDNLSADGAGIFDLSGLTIPDAVLYTATFANPTFSSTGVVFRFTWDSTNASTCTANATRIPGIPTINSVTPNPSDAGLTVALTPPVDPGTSPITSYDGTALVDGAVYDVIVRAVNGVGTGLPSNIVATTASVPELLAAPSSTQTTVGRADPVSPVYIAGFTSDVTISVTTTNGTVAVVGNAGLSVFQCTSCSGATIAFTGPQAAVNVALATLTETASAAGSGAVAISVTKVGDLAPSQAATVGITAHVVRLSTPAAPTVHVSSSTAVTVSFHPVASAASYTVRAYRAGGSPFGPPHRNFTSGTGIAGLNANARYKFTVIAIGDGILFGDSAESASTSARTLPTTPTVAPPTSPCATPRPSQLLPFGVGKVYAVGANGRLSSAPTYAGGGSLTQPIIRSVATPSGRGSWSLAGDGGVFTAGDAPFAGALARRELAAPITDIAGTPCGDGYDVLDTQGRVFSFGGARTYGSTIGMKLNQPMVGLALTCSGRGYYMAAADGGVFTFGNARFHGSLARLPLTSPIFAIVTNCANSGYWLVGRDGGVFAIGKVGYYGSLGASGAHAPIVALLPSPTFHGYTLVAADGRTYPFGDARR